MQSNHFFSLQPQALQNQPGGFISIAKQVARLARPIAAFLLLLGTTLSCQSQPDLEPPAQWGPEGYQNRYLNDKHSSSDFLKWQWQSLWNPTASVSKDALQPVTPRLDQIQKPAPGAQLTWIGHSSLLLQLDGLNILTDPIFSEYASPFPPFGPRRHQPPGLTLSQLPHVHVVLISHNHYDHMDLKSLQQLARQAGGPPLFLVPVGNEQWFLDHIPGTVLYGPERNVHAMNWGDMQLVQAQHETIAFHFDSVQHWSARTLWDRNQSLWGSWAVIHPRFRFWFSGDLGYSQDPQDIGRRYGHFDLAAIAIGSYEPRWFMQKHHIDPAQAVRVMQDVGARQAVGIHWGTFRLSDEALDQPPKDLAKALDQQGLAQDRFFVMHHGETRLFPYTPTASAP